MPLAVDVRALHKSYRAGSPSCLATAAVLRGLDLSIRQGEGVALVGRPGAGKSTLLLCVAGLLSPDRGEIRWFGDSSRATAVKRVIYHVAPEDLLRAGRLDEPRVHLVDLGEKVDREHLRAWTHARRCEGDAVIVAARDTDHFPPGARVIHLVNGVLLERCGVRIRTRVAEAVR